MAFKPEMTFTSSVDGTRYLTIKYYEKVGQSAIDAELEQLVRDGIKEVFTNDYDFRNMVAEAIKSEVNNVPLESIREAVREVLREGR